MKHIAALFLFGVCLVYAQGNGTLAPKQNETSQEAEKECPGRLPCGWLVYNKTTRNQEYFMNNTCKCGQEKSCEKSDEILSAGAYIYRCIEKSEGVSSDTRAFKRSIRMYRHVYPLSDFKKPLVNHHISNDEFQHSEKNHKVPKNVFRPLLSLLKKSGYEKSRLQNFREK